MVVTRSQWVTIGNGKWRSVVTRWLLRYGKSINLNRNKMLKSYLRKRRHQDKDLVIIMPEDLMLIEHNKIKYTFNSHVNEKGNENSKTRNITPIMILQKANAVWYIILSPHVSCQGRWDCIAGKCAGNLYSHRINEAFNYCTGTDSKHSDWSPWKETRDHIHRLWM